MGMPYESLESLILKELVLTVDLLLASTETPGVAILPEAARRAMNRTKDMVMTLERARG